MYVKIKMWRSQKTYPKGYESKVYSVQRQCTDSIDSSNQQMLLSIFLSLQCNIENCQLLRYKVNLSKYLLV